MDARAQDVEDELRALHRVSIFRSQYDVVVDRRLIWGIESRQVFQLATAGERIQALRIATLAFRQRRVQPDLDKPEARLLVQRPRAVAVGAERTDQADNCDCSAGGEQLGNLGDTADVLAARLAIEPQIAAQTLAEVVPVEMMRRQPTLPEQPDERTADT